MFQTRAGTNATGGNTTGHGFVRVGRILAIAAALCTAGCHKPAPLQPPQGIGEIEAAIKAVLESGSNDNLRTIFFPEQPTLRGFTLQVFVDISMSMKGFVPAQAINAQGARHVDSQHSDFYKNSAFVRLLRGLANQSETSEFVGFGFTKMTGNNDRQSTFSQGLHPPLDPNLYSLLNNDYAALIADFPAPQSENAVLPVQRIIISDGVESAPKGAGSALGPTALKIKEWLAAGGAIDLRLCVAPYQGTYYSEELHALGRPCRVECPKGVNRPFLIIAFLSSPRVLPAWNDFWNRTNFTDIAATKPYQLPRKASVDDVAIRPAALLPETERARLQIASKKIWETDPHLLESNWRDIYTACVSYFPRNVRNPSELPLYFEVTSTSFQNLTSGDATSLWNSWKPRLLVFRKAESVSSGSITKPPLHKHETQAGHLSSEKALTAQWTLFKDKDLRMASEILATPTRGAPPSGAKILHFEAPWTRPGEWIYLLTFNPSLEQPAKPPDFSRWSTRDDSTPEDLDRTYNLQSLMEQIVSNTKCSSELKGTLLHIQ